MGGIGLTPMGYAWMTSGLQRICDKVMVVLEGGYNLDALANSSEAVLRSLMIGPNNEAETNKLLFKYNKEYNEGNDSTYEEIS